MSTQQQCDDCDQPYTVWYADSDLWNAVILNRVAMLCPRCFLIRAEPVTEIARITWADPPSARDRQAPTLDHWEAVVVLRAHMSDGTISRTITGDMTGMDPRRTAVAAANELDLDR